MTIDKFQIYKLAAEARVDHRTVADYLRGARRPNYLHRAAVQQAAVVLHIALPDHCVEVEAER